MIPGKLYTKIFISFLLILIITEILIFWLFVSATGRSIRLRRERDITGKLAFSKDIVEMILSESPALEPSENRKLEQFIHRFGDTFRARVWLASSGGRTLLQSFEGKIPEEVSQIEENPTKVLEEAKVYHRVSKHPTLIYATDSIRFPDNTKGTLHILFEGMGPPHEKAGFAWGLVAIGLIVALLTIPVSRLITQRLKRLKQSALTIAGGTLSHRATVKGGDEIGELGRAFNQMADRVERMVRGGKELTANVSHELRSPLARIRIAETLLREQFEKGEWEGWQRHLDDIKEDIEDLDRLIDRILSLSKLDLQKTSLKYAPVRLSDLTAEVLDRHRPVILQKALEVHTDFQQGPPYSGDKEALATAISNIIENAVKFAPQKGPLSIKTLFEGGEWCISVMNSCGPLSSDDMDQIFEPFYRAHHSKAKGTGLGLAITKKIIDKHRGSIEAVNVPGGLEILIKLPIQSRLHRDSK
jgi:two-component system sensor histidine kinase CpxA